MRRPIGIEIRGLPAFACRSPVDRGEAAPSRSSPVGEPLFHAVSLPATALTGDFYLRVRRDRAWLFGLGDVAGHGLEASVYMMMIQEEIERLAERDDLPLAALVGELHATMRRELPGSRFASLVLAEVGADGRAELVNAGHPPPLLRRADGEIFALPPNGPILGPLPQSRWSSLTTRLRSDDTLLLVSDGVLEAMSPGGDEFGTERLWSALARDGALSPRELVLRLLDEVARFRGPEPATDDTSIVVIRA
ncbi:MAG TPA: PP2C family protein-serine/threonine phosphatase [Thermoanaerobaculia bacterium]|nr:PP2C family protein-serine/threonine phosphatase [Thermoanaerobaculia bacterium]